MNPAPHPYVEKVAAALDAQWAKYLEIGHTVPLLKEAAEMIRHLDHSLAKHESDGGIR